MLQKTPAICGEAIGLRIFRSFEDAEQIWRSFQGHAVATPYQQFDWLQTWYWTLGQSEGIEPAIVVGEANGETAFIWPFGIQRQHGLKVCCWLGGKQCNYNMGLFDGGVMAALDAETLRGYLTTISAQCGGIDVFMLLNQPDGWNGLVNPFSAFPGHPSPSPCYRLTLDADYKTLEKRRRSARSVQTLRRKGRKLGETFGEVREVTADGEAETGPMVDAFLAQRAMRLETTGIPNVFAGQDMQNFVRTAAGLADTSQEPVLGFHALVAGEHVCATYAGLTLNGHYSCFVNSINDLEFGKFSPGEILLGAVIEDCCRRGLSSFDLGMGTERYKLSWCDEDPLFDNFIALSLTGRAFTSMQTAKLALKRTIRSNPRFWGYVKRFRKIGHGRS